MNDLILSTSSKGRCIHPGSWLTFKSTNNKVLVKKQPLLISLSDSFSDNIKVLGCSFMSGSSHHPCKTSKIMKSSKKVFINNQRVVIGTSSGRCFADDKALQSQAIITSVQEKVRGI